MHTRLERDRLVPLLAANTPAAFWRLLQAPASARSWETAAWEARGNLAGLPVATQAANVAEIIAGLLGEGQFGPHHWQLSRVKRAYYALRPYLPRAVRPLLQRLAARRQRHGGLLAWPIEDRYVRFMCGTVRRLLESLALTSLPYVHFWPHGRRYALVLTHDVETGAGQRFIGQVAALEEQFGFRSSFSLVPQGYRVDLGLLAELRARGFEVGVHGLRHDGKLFSSQRTFEARVGQINTYLSAWQAAGFRSPMTHRNPAWMQALEAEYDSSFFDSDPFEPMPGGTASIWPFFLGHLVELPYTLAQDHTLLRTLGETTPRLWLEKVAFIRQHCGMALINTHPDYLLNPHDLAVYAAFLARMRQDDSCWPALPRQVASWWRQRAAAPALWDGRQWAAPGLPGAAIGRVSLAEAAGDAELILDPDGR